MKRRSFISGALAALAAAVMPAKYLGASGGFIPKSAALVGMKPPETILPRSVVDSLPPMHPNCRCFVVELQLTPLAVNTGLETSANASAGLSSE